MLALLGAGHKLGVHYTPRVHAVTADDYAALFEFSDALGRRGASQQRLDVIRARITDTTELERRPWAHASAAGRAWLGAAEQAALDDDEAAMIVGGLIGAFADRDRAELKVLLGEPRRDPGGGLIAAGRLWLASVVREKAACIVPRCAAPREP